MTKDIKASILAVGFFVAFFAVAGFVSVATHPAYKVTHAVQKSIDSDCGRGMDTC